MVVAEIEVFSDSESLFLQVIAHRLGIGDACYQKDVFWGGRWKRTCFAQALLLPVEELQLLITDDTEEYFLSLE